MAKTKKAGKGAAVSVNESYSDILSTDALTGIPNRRGFYAATEALVRGGGGTEYVICCINIDKFKLVNDLFGSKTGDELLVFLAGHLKSYAEDMGTYARLTADNFAICIPNEENLYQHITAMLSAWLSDYPLSINIITRCGFYHVHDPEVEVPLMCDRANLAIQEIKGSYDRSYAVYDDKVRKRIIQEQEILNEMKTALDEGQFAVYYQPKFNMESGKLIGSEALVRWIHPEKGLISPGVFVPIFEKNGFISSLDQYVWESVCRDIKDWLERGLAVCPVSINVSRAELYNKGLVNYLVDLVDRYSIPQDLVQLEITESAYTDDPDQIIKMVQDLKSSGFVILMDDFGSGYSSLNTLKDVPVDVLKLDLKFLYNMDHNLKANYILKSVVQMAMRLDLVVIAEGVETETQAEFLKSIGCIRAQGYLYAKPMPKSELEFFLSDPNKVSQTDEDTREGIVNIDDVLAGFHREDELEWYRAAVVQLKAMLYEYDIENDILMVFDMQMDVDDEKRELQRLEFASFTNSISSGAFICKEDTGQISDMIHNRYCEPCDFRVRGTGVASRGFRWYRQDGRILTTSDGTPKSIVGVLRDISDEKSEETLLEILTAFEHESDERMIIERVLGSIIYGMAAHSAGILFTRSRKSTDLGGVIRDRYGDRRVVFDADYIRELDNEINDFENNEFGISTLDVDEYELYGSATQDLFFSNGERAVAVYRARLTDQMMVVFFTAYRATGKRFDTGEMRHLGEVFKTARNSFERMYAARFEKENTDMYTHAFRKSGTRLWEWDINSHLLHRSGNAIDNDGLGEWVEDVPDSYVDSGIIHPDYREDYLSAYKALSEGKNATVMVKKMQSDGSYYWMHIGYSVITDENGDPVKAIGIGEDVNQLYHSQMKTREKILRSKNTMEKQRGWFKADLTEDVVTEADGNLIMVKAGERYSDFVNRMCEDKVIPEDVERFKKYNVIEELKHAYKYGDQCLSSVYRYKSEDGEVKRRALSVDISKGDDGHLYAFIRHRGMDSAEKYESYIKGEVQWDEEFCLYGADSFNDIVRGIMENEPEKKGALYIIDMDKSTLIKDSLGEKYANELLLNVTMIIKSIMPDSTLFARLLDDRFAAYIPEYTSQRDCFRIYRDIQKSIFSAFTIGKINYVLSASIGLCYSEYCEGSYDRLYGDALYEMLEAKAIEAV